MKKMKQVQSITNAPLLAVDTAVLTIINDKLYILLIQISSGPYMDKWAIPGGLVRWDESLDEAASRVLSEKANIKNIYLEQLYSFGDPKRDVRKRSVSVAYMSLISSPDKLNISTQKYYKGIEWFKVDELPQMAFDHSKIVSTACERLKGKIFYTNIAYSLLPEEFTLTQLQKIYEALLGGRLDKRNFRKRIMSLGFIKQLDKKQTDVVHRPAALYKFVNRKLELL